MRSPSWTPYCKPTSFVKEVQPPIGPFHRTISALRRTRSGPFEVVGASSFADLRDGRATVRAPREAIPSLAEQRVSADDAARLARGMRVGASIHGERAALVDETGALLAIAERSGNEWQPRVVLANE